MENPLWMAKQALVLFLRAHHAQYPGDQALLMALSHRQKIQEKVTAAFEEEFEKSKLPGYKPADLDEPEDDDVPEVI